MLFCLVFRLKNNFDFVIVIAQVLGIYGSKQTESEGSEVVARGRGLFTTAINPWHLCCNCHLVDPLLLL